MQTFRRWRSLLLLAGACLYASPAAAQVLISEIFYKGPETPGWNSYWSRSYVELRNAGDNPVDLSGWGLRYWGTSDPGVVVPLSGVLPAGARYLVAFGASHPVSLHTLPAPDASSAVEIVQQRSFAVLDASSVVQDLVGVGFDAPQHETRAPYPYDYFLALARRLDGCFDSGDGFWDFKGRYGEPQNTTAPAVACGPPPPCTFTLTPTEVTLPAQYPSAGFQLRAPEHCVWTAQGPPWLQFTTTHYIGDLDVSILAEIFESGPPRTGTITFGNGTTSVSATVTQPPKTPCVFAFSPSGPQAFGPDMGIRTVAVSTQIHCSMNPVASGNWLYPRGNPIMGPGDFMYQVGPLASGSRIGTFTIGNAVLLIVQDAEGTPDVTDADNDTLIDAWERRFGLDAAAGVGDNGPLGDPDGDGVTNFQEQIQGSHPLGLTKRFFAEGVANQFFQTTIAVFTPDPEPAIVQLRYMTEYGDVFSELVEIPGHTRRTFTPGTLPGIAGKSFSTSIESTRRLVADRTVVWGGGYGAHAETALPATSPDWFLAEGSTSADFSLFYLLQNPWPDQVTATIRFLLPGGAPPIEKSYWLVPFSRLTVPVDAVDPLLANTDVSAAIHATAPIVVERAMYLSKPDRSFLAGHESAGVVAASTEWFLAEGATGDFFDTFILIANPGTEAASVTVDYLLSDGRTFQKTYSLRPESRTTIWVDAEEIPAGSGVRPLAAVNVSTRIVATRPIVVERTMWWPGPAASADFWYESHNSPGATVATGAWALAEGIVGTADNWDTYVLIANTDTAPATVRITAYPEQGQSTQRTFEIAPRSRFTVSMRDGFGLTDERFATVVQGVAGGSRLVVERAMYSTTAGVLWTAGTNALATPVP
jgi:hypothetical protein